MARGKGRATQALHVPHRRGRSTVACSTELDRQKPGEGQTGLSAPSICPPRPATISTTSRSPARSARSACRSPISRHARPVRGHPLGRDEHLDDHQRDGRLLLALYVALADEQGADRAKLTGTVQNDILKEYLPAGPVRFPPAPSLRLIKDVIVYTHRETPKRNHDHCWPITCKRREPRRIRSLPSPWRRRGRATDR